MRIKVTILLSLLFSACSPYQQVKLNSDVLTNLNSKLAIGYQDGAYWTSTPEKIAQHLFPSISHDGGAKIYEVTKQTRSKADCTVTVLEEGPIDDEVTGEKHTVRLNLSDGRWKIVAVDYEVRRRH